MKYTIKVLILAFSLIFFTFNSTGQQADDPEVKYIFLFIGDGMGLAHVNAAEAYLRATGEEQNLSFTGFPETGFMSTYAANRFITGSAAAGTAMATGNKTNIGRISMDPEGTQAYETIAEKAKKEGMKVGILSSVSIDHATPAVFYAHQPSRNMYFEIAVDLTNSGFDFFGGGGFREPTGTLDGKEISIPELARQKGYKYVNTDGTIRNLKKGSEKVIAVSPKLDESSAMPYSIDNEPEDISLADFTEKAIELLENENGFFIMVEGGKIDWASHANDPATVLHDVLAFDEAVAEAYEFYEKYPDETLIIVTADHETGGLGIGNKISGYGGDISLLKYQSGSFVAFNDIIMDFSRNPGSNPSVGFNRMEDIYKDFFGLGEASKISLSDEEMLKIREAFNEVYYSGEVEKSGSSYGDYNPFRVTMTNVLSARSGLGWTTFSHTGIDVPVWAIGQGAEKFRGSIDNTDLAKIIRSYID
jgi:alkaline phosphatase